MRTRLNIPQPEQVLAKSMGAVYDAKRREWYIEDVEDIAPFTRWMSPHLLRPCKAVQWD